MSIIVASKAKAHLKAKGCNCAGDALEGLEGMLTWHLEQAGKRAKENGRKTVRKTDFCTCDKGSMADCVVGSKSKAMLKDAGCNCAGDALDGLSMLAAKYLDQAAERAQANGRKTVRKHDFMCA